MLSTSFNSKFYHQAYRDSKTWNFLSRKCCGVTASSALLCSSLDATPKSSGRALPAPCSCSRSCEGCGRQVWGSSLGTNLTSAETLSWRDTLVLIGMGQVSAGRTIKAQQPRGIDSLTQPKESFSEGSDHDLDSRGRTHFAPCLPTCTEEKHDPEVSPGSLSLPALTSHRWIWLFPMKNEPKSPGASSVIYRELDFHMGFPAAANPKSQREEERKS